MRYRRAGALKIWADKLEFCDILAAHEHAEVLLLRHIFVHELWEKYSPVLATVTGLPPFPDLCW